MSNEDQQFTRIGDVIEAWPVIKQTNECRLILEAESQEQLESSFIPDGMEEGLVGEEEQEEFAEQ